MDIELRGGKRIGDGQPCYVVAELGQNHQGCCYTATRLMKAAADAGADAVKFCKRDIPSELTRAAYDAPYVGPQSFGPTYGMHREALELSADEYRHLKERLRYNEWPLTMFATACDKASVDLLEETINPPMHKVASRDLDNLPLLAYLNRLSKPMILSAGMATFGEIESALKVITSPVVLMVCTSEYPTPNIRVGLRRIGDYRRRYCCPVGLSDHTAGITAGICAVALGACMIEKHLTLSRAMKGTDHAASLEPDGLRRMVAKIREVEEMMQDTDTTKFVDCTRAKLGRSLVTTRDIPAGKQIETEDLCLKSPGTGIRHEMAAYVVGRIARRALPADVTIDPSDIMEAADVPA